MKNKPKEIFQDYTNKELAKFVQCALFDGHIYSDSFKIGVEKLDNRIHNKLIINMENKVKVVTQYLKPYVNDLFDNKIYTWDPNITNLKLLINDFDYSKLISDHKFEQEIQLKNLIYNKLNEDISIESKIEVAKWIIKDWGGITLGNFEDKQIENQKTIKGTKSLIIETFENADKMEFELPFERISSTSKVLGFYKPNLYAVFDSRVAYTLNWILLKNGETNQFFPIPDGRNSKMMAFDLNVIIRLLNIDKYYSEDISNKQYIGNVDSKNNIYISKEKAYKSYLELIKKVNENLFPDQKDKLYYTEMLLFSIADNQIFKDITSSLAIVLNK